MEGMGGSRRDSHAAQSFSPVVLLAATLLLAPVPAALACTGDWDGDGAVTVTELIRGVNIALGGLQINECSAFDRLEGRRR
jgi:hypothetical protein